MSDLLALLTRLEVELHHPGVPCTRERLHELLHARFREVGRSGRPYDRQTVVDFLASQSSPPDVESSNFSLQVLGPQASLLTYRSAHRQPTGERVNHTYRSSVWVHESGTWQLLYHQGTPAAQPW